jgi:hypothetical protein
MASPTNLPYGTALTGSNAQAWAVAILQGLGAPTTAANVNSLADWFALEGGGGQNNPLNTTMSGPGSTGSINSVGVQGFSTPADGVAATVATLNQPIFSSIVSALKSGNGLIGDTAAAVESALSSWSGGGYREITGSSNLSGVSGSGTTTTPPTTSPGNVQGVQGNVPGVSAPGYQGSGAITGGGSTTTPATPSSTGLPSILQGAAGLLQDVATALDYFFGMFGRGQGWRLVFTLIAGAALLLALKTLAAAGAIPGGLVPSAVPVPV